MFEAKQQIIFQKDMFPKYCFAKGNAHNQPTKLGVSQCSREVAVNKYVEFFQGQGLQLVFSSHAKRTHSQTTQQLPESTQKTAAATTTHKRIQRIFFFLFLYSRSKMYRRHCTSNRHVTLQLNIQQVVIHFYATYLQLFIRFCAFNLTDFIHNPFLSIVI